jgi:RNA polymerase sigma-70 factor, ECF subfamily
LAASPISDRSDGQLVLDVRAGSSAAFNLLMRRWERKIYSYLVYLTGEFEDAFDLSQDVFLSAYANIGKLRRPEAFRQWLFEIAHNVAYSRMRKAMGRDASPADDRLDGPVSSVRLMEGAKWERVESKILVEKTLTALPAEQREAIVLKVYQGLKFEEIAAIQNCPVSTVKTRFYAGFAEFRKILKPPDRP